MESADIYIFPVLKIADISTMMISARGSSPAAETDLWISGREKERVESRDGRERRGAGE